ncbi:MAG TPA: DUF6777 domain-containing protein [Actinophytocola sp.]|uniref:DUF6777 domain-containing protein n=1 Tax=Actinophytocola sp. TaxID=1872138 RepID=UPI002DDC92E8|nr:DUF6777 domain-containing protein [Actinophytocola sp.]HEV2781148.1 DUF6777 domain-containing protein [Actinophytocola sp.]
MIIANLARWSAAFGGALALASFLVIPVLVGGMGGSHTGLRLAAAVGGHGPPGLFWLLPAAAVVLILGAIFAAGAGIGVTAAGLAAVGQVAALKALQWPEVADAAYRAGIDPASGVGPGYWLSLAGLLVALAGGVLARPSWADRAWPVLAGAANGIVIGTLVASAVLDINQDAARRDIVALATAVLGDDAFGPDLAIEHAPVPPDPVGRGEIAGDSEQLYGGAFGRSSCDQGGMAALVTKAEPARSGGWAHAVTSDVPGQPPGDLGRYLADLTPVRLRADTRVTAHRFVGDRSVPYQAILQSGTAVLVDRRGVPRVRCAGAVPLAPPRGPGGVEHLDPLWPGFDPAAVVSVTPSQVDIRQFGLVDAGRRFRRPVGTTGDRDVDQVPERALLDGAYALTGKQAACNLNDCRETVTRTLTVAVTDCPDRCRVASDGWAGAIEMVETSGGWRASGTSAERFDCRGESIPTTFTLILRVKTGAVIAGTWTAEQIEGTYAKESPSGPCLPGAVSWDVSGTRS